MRVDHKPIPLIFIGGHKKLNLQVSPHIIHRNENKRCFSLLSSSLLSIVEYTSIILA